MSISRDVEALLYASESDDDIIDQEIGNVCLEDILREDAESDEDITEMSNGGRNIKSIPSFSSKNFIDVPGKTLLNSTNNNFSYNLSHSTKIPRDSNHDYLSTTSEVLENSKLLKQIMQEAENDDEPIDSTLFTNEIFQLSNKKSLYPTDIDKILSSSENNESQPSHLTAQKSPRQGSASNLNSYTSTLNNNVTSTFREDSSSIGSAMNRLRSIEISEHQILRGGKRDIVNPLNVKRRMRSVRGHGVGMVRIDTLSQISQQLAKHGQKNVDIGNPTCLAVHPKFISVGTSKGLILLFDHFQVARRILGDSIDPAITSIDMCIGGDFLISGNAVGSIVLWDFIRGVSLKTVSDAHVLPLTAVRCFSSTEPAVITSDSAGVVNRITFRRVMWTAWVSEVTCLLDRSVGPLPGLSVLPGWVCKGNSQVEKGESSLSYDGKKCSFEKNRLIALGSAANTYVVRIHPKVEVIYKWGRPEQVASTEGGSPIVPYISWSPPQMEGTSNPKATLARGWSKFIQLLSVEMEYESENITEPGQDITPIRGDEPSVRLELAGSISTLSTVLVVEWLSSTVLTYITLDMTVFVYDVTGGTVIETATMGSMSLVRSNLVMKESTEENTDKKEFSKSVALHGNCIRVSDGNLYALGENGRLCVLRMQDWAQRVGSLIAAGEWLEALSVALDQYEKFSAGPDILLTDKQTPKNEALRDSLARLLSRYVRLAVDNAPCEAEEKQIGTDSGQTGRYPGGKVGTSSLAQSHFQMLAGVCAEYCIVTERIDVLFGEVFARYKETGHTGLFLETLEPYVLEGRLKFSQSTALKEVAEYTSQISNDNHMLERWALHLDPEALAKSPATLTLLRKRRLYSALMYICGRGVHDFLSPLESLLQDIMSIADSEHINHEGIYEEKSETVHTYPYPSDSNFKLLGYKAILFLRYCFMGKIFPKEDDIFQEKFPAVRAQLLYLLCQRVISSGGLRSSLQDPTSTSTSTMWKALSYPYLRILLYVDTPLTIETLMIALDSTDADFRDIIPFQEKGIPNSAEQDQIGTKQGRIGAELAQKASEQGQLGTEYSLFGTEEGILAAEAIDMNVQKCPSRRFILCVLATILSPGLLGEKDNFYFNGHFLDSDGKNWPTDCENSVFEVTAKYLERSLAQVPPPLVNAVLRYVVEGKNQEELYNESALRQSRLFMLLHQIPPTSIETDSLISLAENARYFRASVAVRKIHSLVNGISQENFSSIVRCYLLDREDESFRSEVFSFISNEARHLEAKGGNPRIVVLNNLCSLLEIDPISTVRVIALVGIEHKDVLEELKSNLLLQFRYLDVLQGSVLAEDDIKELTPEQRMVYLSLLVRFRPNEVRNHLSEKEGVYSLEKALELCRQHKISDSIAYLLEKSGDSAGALALTISSLDEQLKELRKALLSAPLPRGPARVLSGLEEGRRVSRSLVAIIEICQRAGSSNTDDVSQKMWFKGLDCIVKAKTECESGGGMIKACDTLLQQLLDGMTGYVPLPAIVQKVISDHGEAPLCEFRNIIMSMLSACSYEIEIYRSASALLYDCAYRTNWRRKRQANAGIRVSRVNECELGHNLVENISSTHGVVKLSNGGSACIQYVGLTKDQRDEDKATAVHRWRLKASRNHQKPPLKLQQRQVSVRPKKPLAGENGPPSEGAKDENRGSKGGVRDRLISAMPQMFSNVLQR